MPKVLHLLPQLSLFQIGISSDCRTIHFSPFFSFIFVKTTFSLNFGKHAFKPMLFITRNICSKWKLKDTAPFNVNVSKEKWEEKAIKETDWMNDSWIWIYRVLVHFLIPFNCSPYLLYNLYILCVYQLQKKCGNSCLITNFGN